jgi:hypothetical protein
MGKKPVLGLMGVCWMALALAGGSGCNCCDKRYHPPPTWGQRNNATPVTGPTVQQGTPAMQQVPGQQPVPGATPAGGAAPQGTPQGFQRAPQSTQQGAFNDNTDLGARGGLSSAQAVGGRSQWDTANSASGSAIQQVSASAPAGVDSTAVSPASGRIYEAPSGTSFSQTTPGSSLTRTSYPSSSRFAGSDDLNSRAQAVPPPPPYPSQRQLPSTSLSPSSGLSSGGGASGGMGPVGLSAVSETPVPVPPSGTPSQPTPLPLPSNQRTLPGLQQ